MMKYLLYVICFLASLDMMAQETPLVSNVHHWISAPLTKSNFGSTRNIFDGSGKILSKHSLKGLTIKPGKKLIYKERGEGDELFFIVKTGPIESQLNGVSKILDKGSVVFVLPGDELIFKNLRKEEVELYEMRMRASQPNRERGISAGDSFMMDWYDMEYRPHDRGGVRQLFDRKTIMTNRFDIHITSLNPGISSHPPHTHVNEEIILMIDGAGEMVLGDKKQRIVTGDAAWVESMIPHNITNKAKRPAVYFAIQWN
jgi:(S)-ureidoglycine aminohydrolase